MWMRTMEDYFYFFFLYQQNKPPPSFTTTHNSPSAQVLPSSFHVIHFFLIIIFHLFSLSPSTPQCFVNFNSVCFRCVVHASITRKNPPDTFFTLLFELNQDFFLTLFIFIIYILLVQLANAEVEVNKWIKWMSTVERERFKDIFLLFRCNFWRNYGN